MALDKFYEVDDNLFEINVIGFNEEQKASIKELCNDNDCEYYFYEKSDYRRNDVITIQSYYVDDINNVLDALEDDYPINDNWDNIEIEIDYNEVQHSIEIKIENDGK